MYNESSSTKEPSSSLFRSVSKDSAQKEAAMYTFCREIRQKSLHAALERSAAVVAASSGAKDLEFMKAYGLPGVDQVKDLSFSTRMAGIGLERLRSTSMHGKLWWKFLIYFFSVFRSNFWSEDNKTLAIKTDIGVGN